MSQLTTRDYKGSGRRPLQVSGMKEFGLGALVGVLLAGTGAALIVARARHGQAHTPVACATPAPSTADAPGSTAGAAAGAAAGRAQSAPPAPQYDFYQMLPKFTVPVAGGGTAVPARRAAPAASSAANYILQIGSYRSDAEARRVRDRLARMGLAAEIQRVTARGGVLNRVRVGPIDTAELERIRAELAAANIHPLIIPSRGE